MAYTAKCDMMFRWKSLLFMHFRRRYSRAPRRSYALSSRFSNENSCCTPHIVIEQDDTPTQRILLIPPTVV
jgi:hypothetical protein